MTSNYSEERKGQQALSTYQDTQVSAELRPTVEHSNKYSQLNLSDFKYKMRIKLLIFPSLQSSTVRC